MMYPRSAVTSLVRLEMDYFFFFVYFHSLFIYPLLFIVLYYFILNELFNSSNQMILKALALWYQVIFPGYGIVF